MDDTAPFQGAFLNCYVRKMKKFFWENIIPFMIWFIAGNVPRHPAFIGDLYPDIKVVFLSLNTIPWIQPMDQGVIAGFEAYDLRRTFA